MPNISVYSIKIPEYKVKKYSLRGGSLEKYQGTPWVELDIPKIYFDKQPDFKKIGKKLDALLRKHFFGKNIVVRALSSQEHKDKDVEKLIEIIKKLGYDRYDPGREGDRYENIENKHIDFFALPFKIEKKGEYFRYLIEPFYFWPIHDRGEPIKIDIAIVYDLSKLELVEHQYKGRESEIKKDGFVFKDQNNRSDAVIGIILIQ